ncbi:MAG: cytochrome c biogenesis protein CcsA [Bacteroidota bacterium]|nr:cytochrome c biogenesis protein CcsA [Bacteroidota bacterium]
MEESYFKNEHLLIGNLGHLAVALTFGASVLALLSFIFASKDGDQKIKWFKIGRWAFWVHGLAVFAIVTCLFLIIKNHYFEYHYAWRHSSLDLPSEYMISCFWEGQEGSFLLWLFWQMILGVFVLFKVNKWTSPVMVFIALSQVVLSSMLLGVDFDWFHFGSSPFELLRDHDTQWIDPNLPVYTMRGMETSDYLKLIKDGNGLNPLLQNYWMVIHPPTLFLGFASTIVPFAFAMAALWKRNYKEWIVPALPWTLFSAAILGTGVIMGAMWAYESLSFGGFWAWDPVENASLVPWLTLVAGLHVMLIAKSTGHSLKEAFILITITFLLILYSTFLTRSGILQNTSVHAFTDDGLSNQLFVFMMLFVLLNLYLMVRRWKEIPSLKTEQQLWSREFWMFIGSLVLVLSAMQIIFTTSIPVWNKILTMTGLDKVMNANVAPPKIDVYNRIQLPIAVLIGLLTAVTQFLKYKNTNLKKIARLLLSYFVISVILTIAGIYLFKTYNPEYVTMLFASIFTVVGNSGYIIQVLKGKFSVSGASVGHIGFGLMLIGILVSTTGKRVLTSNNFTMPDQKMDSTQAENMLLIKDKPVQIADYTATYRGDSNVGVNHYLAVDYERIDTATHKVVEQFTLHPNAQANPKMGLVSNPDTRHYLTEDIYTHITSFSGLDPQENQEEWVNADTVILRKGQQIMLGNDNELTLQSVKPLSKTGLDFELHFMLKNLKGEEPITLHCKIEKNHLVHSTAIDKGLLTKLDLLDIKPIKNGDEIDLNVTLLTSFKNTMNDYIILKAIRFPYVNLLWAGTVIMVVGFFIAFFKRKRDAKRVG